MRTVPTRTLLRLTAGLAATAALLAVSVAFAKPLQAAQTLTVSAGADSRGGDVELNAFAPHAITVTAGDSVTWRIDSTEFHTISFLAGNPAPPFVTPGPDGVFFNPAAVNPSGGTSYDGNGMTGSGLLTKAQTYTLTFPTPGTYEYVCLVHPGMKGTVVVKSAGETVDSQAAVDARRSAEINAALVAHGIPLLMSNGGELPAERVSPGIAAGAGDDTIMIPRFLPERVTIKAGDSVTWIWKDPMTPHTVTFLGGATPPDLVIPRPQADGPPRLELNPAVLAPSGDPTAFDGGYLSSGFIDPTQIPPGGPSPTFTMRFDQPGTYEYVCLLHENMRGTIVVES